MKKLTLFIILLSCLASTYSQEVVKTKPLVIGGSFHFGLEENGSLFPIVGTSFGSIGITTPSDNDDSKNSVLSFRPLIGKQINDRFLAGILLDISLSSYTSTVRINFPQSQLFDFKRKTNQYGIGLFTRHSFVPEGRFDFFVQPFAQYFFLNRNEFIDDEKSSDEALNYFALGSDLGVLYNINDRWRATLRIGGIKYVNGSWETVSAPEENFSSFGLNLNLSSIQFGIELKI